MTSTIAHCGSESKTLQIVGDYVQYSVKYLMPFANTFIFKNILKSILFANKHYKIHCSVGQRSLFQLQLRADQWHWLSAAPLLCGTGCLRLRRSVALTLCATDSLWHQPSAAPALCGKVTQLHCLAAATASCCSGFLRPQLSVAPTLCGSCTLWLQQSLATGHYVSGSLWLQLTISLAICGSKSLCIWLSVVLIHYASI